WTKQQFLDSPIFVYGQSGEYMTMIVAQHQSCYLRVNQPPLLFPLCSGQWAKLLFGKSASSGRADFAQVQLEKSCVVHSAVADLHAFPRTAQSCRVCACLLSTGKFVRTS